MNISYLWLPAVWTDYPICFGRVIVGAKNIVRTLSSSGGKNVNEQMKKTIAEVRFY